MIDDDSDLAQLRCQLRRLLGGAVTTDGPLHLSNAYGDLLTFLLENTDFGFSAVMCSYCGRDDMPVTMTEGGTTPEYACPICYAENAIETAKVIDPAEAKAEAEAGR